VLTAMIMDSIGAAALARRIVVSPTQMRMADMASLTDIHAVCKWRHLGDSDVTNQQ
jgi:hypothetical protein